MLALLLTALALQVPGNPPVPAVPPAPATRPAPPPPPALPALPAEAPLPPTAGPLRGEWGAPSGKRITIEDTASIDDALEKIADAAGWNVVLNTGRTGNRLLVMKLRQVAVEDALRFALSGTRLVATRTGNTVVVAESEEVAPVGPTLAGFEKPTGKRFTGAFDDDEVGEALGKIAGAAGLSIILPPGGASGTVTAQFRDVPVEDALRAVLAQSNLRAERQGALLVVHAGGAPGWKLPPLPPGLGRDARRAAEQALREAERLARRAEADGGADSDAGRDRQSTGSDLTVNPGERVRDVNVVRGNLLLRAGSEARDVSAVSGNVRLEPGARARDVVAILKGVKLDGGAQVRQAVAVFGDVEVGPGASVERDVISIGGRVRVDPQADVGGATRSIALPSLPGVVGITTGHLLGGGDSLLLTVVETLVKFAVLFVLGLLVLSVFPRRLEAVAGSMVASPWKSVFTGLLGTFAMLLLTVLLVATVVGILLVPVQVLAVIAGGVLGLAALLFHVGRSVPLPAGKSTAVVQLAVGTALYAVLTSIPVIGFMTWMAAWLLTFGAVLRTRFGQPTASILPTTPVEPPPMPG